MAEGGPAPRITRRRLLDLGAAAVAGVGTAGVLAGPRAWRRLTRDCGPAGTRPAARGAIVERGGFRSATVPGEVGFAIWPPSTAGRLPLCLCLPGRAAPGAWVMDSLGLHDAVAEGAERGDWPAFAVAAMDGGESYWHARADGEDRMAALLDEFLPICRERGMGADRPIAIAGWSMGGYGALLAAQRRPRVFTAALAASPAVWSSAGETAEGAFDDDADFGRNDLRPGLGRLRGTALRIDCGAGDPFAGATRELIAAAPGPPAGGIEPGCHELAYWWRVLPAQVAFLGRSLELA